MIVCVCNEMFVMKFILIFTLFFVCLICANGRSFESINDIQDEKFNKKFDDKQKNDSIKDPIFNFITKILNLLNIRKVINDLAEGKESKGVCSSCKFGLSMLQHLIQFKKDRNEIANIIYSLCSSLHIESSKVCEGIVDEYKVNYLNYYSYYYYLNYYYFLNYYNYYNYLKN